MPDLTNSRAEVELDVLRRRETRIIDTLDAERGNTIRSLVAARAHGLDGMFEKGYLKAVEFCLALYDRRPEIIDLRDAIDID